MDHQWDQCKFDHILEDAILCFNYDIIVDNMKRYPRFAKEYLHRNFIDNITMYRTKDIYTEETNIIIMNICKFIFEYALELKAKINIHHNNDIILKWAIDTQSIKIVIYILSLSSFNITELLNDDNEDFLYITNEILYYLVKNHKKYGIMKISKYYLCIFELSRHLINLGVGSCELFDI